MDNFYVLFTKSMNQYKLETLWKLRENINWNIEDERVEFFRQLDPLINSWVGPLPDIADIFEWRGEVEYLLSDCIKIMKDNYYQAKRFIDFVIATGYKDEPLVDKDGKPRLRRTTPVHLATRRWFVNRDQIIRELFKIYQANYIDENGQTHFHVACSYGFDDIVEKFLDLGQDPNCVTEKTGDSPLHLALPYFNERLVQLLLRRGAYPNLANAQGLTPLHILCARDDVDIDLLETFFDMCDDEHQTLQVNAQDKLGNTPLYTTLKRKNKKLAEFLLRKGSDPNLADESESTALHIICKSNIFFEDEKFFSMFFKIIDENQQMVHIDAKDNLGRTPLQWAVANLMPHAVNIFLKRGADLSNFTFPDTNYFAKKYTCLDENDFHEKFIFTSKTLAIVDSLEEAGFEMDQDVALRIAKFFAKHEMFQEEDFEKSCLDHEKLTSRVKKITIKKNLPLFELIQLEPKQAAKLVTPKDYAKLATSRKFLNMSKEHQDNFAQHLCEEVARGFFRRLALYPFWEKVIWYRLPLECCEMILENLMNRDLCNIYLAATISDGDSIVVSSIRKIMKLNRIYCLCSLTIVFVNSYLQYFLPILPLIGQISVRQVLFLNRGERQKHHQKSNESSEGVENWIYSSFASQLPCAWIDIDKDAVPILLQKSNNLFVYVGVKNDVDANFVKNFKRLTLSFSAPIQVLLIMLNHKNDSSTKYLDLLKQFWQEELVDVTIISISSRVSNQSHHQIEIINRETDYASKLHHYNPFTRVYTNRVLNSSSRLFPAKLDDLHGYKLRVGYENDYPYSMFNQVEQIFEGICFTFLDTIKRKMNFSVELDEIFFYELSSKEIEKNVSTIHELDVYLTGSNLVYKENHPFPIDASTVIRIERVYSLVPLMRKPVLQLGSGIQWSLLVILGLVAVVWLSSFLLLRRDDASSLLSHWQPLDMGLQMMGSTISAQAVTLRERLLFGCVLTVASFYSSNILAQLTNLKLGREAYMRFETFQELDESGLVPMVHPTMFNLTFRYSDDPTIRRCVHRVYQNTVETTGNLAK
ncbi:unnamed protein product [Trichogramma brassicae]|uniref:Uncharacterized protein n=1 Tax=Trichogramma brassicae TaxID=86971 RepID=A0A6H5IUP1_9HYME|nr:unnamed protein product [Trichogramma brassicae]